MIRCGVALLLWSGAMGMMGAGSASAQLTGPAQRRMQLLTLVETGESAIPQIAKALDDPNAVVRRTAARLLIGIGPAANQTVARGLDNEDFLVRRTCLVTLCEAGGAVEIGFLAKAMRDEHSAVRLIAVQRLACISPRDQTVDALLEAACKDDVDAIRTVAARATWPFHRDNVSLRAREDYDHDVAVIQTIPLPKDGWRFKLDPERRGHRTQWFEPAFDDSAWDTISIEQAWQKAGYEYIGVTWYRRTIELPEKPDCTAVDIHFKGVDESAWIWLNGMYIGQHDIGPEGWNKPFTLDISKEARWGQANQITVRAMNTAHAGGIWCPVQIEVLK